MRQHEPTILRGIAIRIDRLAAALDAFDLLHDQSPEFDHTGIGGAEHFQRAVHDRTLRGHDHDVLRYNIVANPVPVLVASRYFEPRHFILLGHSHPLRVAVGAVTNVERMRIVDGDLIGAGARTARVDGRYIGKHFCVTDAVGIRLFLITFQYDASKKAV